MAAMACTRKVGCKCADCAAWAPVAPKTAMAFKASYSGTYR